MVISIYVFCPRPLPGLCPWTPLPLGDFDLSSVPVSLKVQEGSGRVSHQWQPSPYPPLQRKFAPDFYVLHGPHWAAQGGPDPWTPPPPEQLRRWSPFCPPPKQILATPLNIMNGFESLLFLIICIYEQITTLFSL